MKEKKEKEKREKKEKKRRKKEKRKVEEEVRKEEEKVEKKEEEYLNGKPEFYDIESEHCLIPLLPSNNSYNRNMVLAFNHSGVKFIFESIQKLIMEKNNLNTTRNEII